MQSVGETEQALQRSRQSREDRIGEGGLEQNESIDTLPEGKGHSA